jgi:hypothetical protein
MEHLVGRIQASNYVYFTEDELGPDCTGHNKPLYIKINALKTGSLKPSYWILNPF